jgi:hypothetical protein
MRVIKFGRTNINLELTVDDMHLIVSGMGIAENEGQISNSGVALLRQIEELARQMDLENRNVKPLHP